jgi:hypothetical protein
MFAMFHQLMKYDGYTSCAWSQDDTGLVVFKGLAANMLRSSKQEINGSVNCTKQKKGLQY